MKQAIFIGLAAGILIGAAQYVSMTGTYTGTLGGLLYYSPLLIFFASIYVAIKRTRDSSEDQLTFKIGLKTGGVASLIICLIWGIAFFIALTHQNVREFMNYKIANHQESEIPQYLRAFSNRQTYFDMTKFWVMPNFLLGFLITVMATIFLLKRQKAK